MTINKFINFDEFLNFNPHNNLQTYAVIGNPVGHSMSPLLHGILNTNCNYIAVHVLPHQLEEFCYAAAKKLNGFNITIPYKKDIIKYLFLTDKISADLNSVNTVVCKDGKLFGYNTDVYGIEKAISTATKIKGKKTLILGAGGAASAAVYALKNGGAFVTIAARDTAKAKADFADTDVIDINTVKGSYDIVINCTPCGMKGQENSAAIDINNISGCSFIYDTVYNPLITKFIKEGKSQNIPCENGLSMLIHQGAKAQNIWGNEINLDDVIYIKLRAEIIRKKLLEKGKKAIALCGFMSCGKSAAAKYIMQNFGLSHIDTDDLIVKKAGKSIKEIFEAEGENHFRTLESEAVLNIDYSHTAIISLGGGVVTKNKNVEALKKNCLIVYIDLPLQECLKRNKGGRPLLNANQDKIEELYQNRKQIYTAVSDIIIQGQNTVNQTAEEIIYNI